MACVVLDDAPLIDTFPWLRAHRLVSWAVLKARCFNGAAIALRTRHRSHGGDAS
jgi:hypothetical protein